MSPNSSESKEFLEGYHAKVPRTYNPYAHGQPWLAEFPDKILVQKCEDWFAGWDCHFHGEEF